MVNDVARAYFNARMDRLLYCELPEEDKEAGKDLVGRIDLCLYGIRDAARGKNASLIIFCASVSA